MIQTSQAPGAATRAPVTLRLVFKAAVVEHDVHADPDDFARGAQAQAVIKCLEHGSIQEVWVGHSDEGMSGSVLH